MFRHRFDIELKGTDGDGNPTTAKREVIVEAETREEAETGLFANYPAASIVGYGRWAVPDATLATDATDEEENGDGGE